MTHNPPVEVAAVLSASLIQVFDLVFLWPLGCTLLIPEGKEYHLNPGFFLQFNLDVILFSRKSMESLELHCWNQQTADTWSQEPFHNLNMII